MILEVSEFVLVIYLYIPPSFFSLPLSPLSFPPLLPSLFSSPPPLSPSLLSSLFPSHLRTPAKRTITLSRVEQWVTGGHYSRLDHLQSDLLALFRQARQAGGGRESQMYQDSVATQRQYISVRDSVCQNGQLLWSPALDYTHQ